MSYKGFIWHHSHKYQRWPCRNAFYQILNTKVGYLYWQHGVCVVCINPRNMGVTKSPIAMLGNLTYTLYLCLHMSNSMIPNKCLLITYVNVACVILSKLINLPNMLILGPDSCWLSWSCGLLQWYSIIVQLNSCIEPFLWTNVYKHGICSKRIKIFFNTIWDRMLWLHLYWQ